MPNATEDFWPDEIPDTTDPAPVALLKEQAALLGEKTNHDVEGVVSLMSLGDKVCYGLYLKAEDLGDYLYKLLEIQYPTLDLVEGAKDVPVLAWSMAGGPPVTLKTDEFPQWLRTQLSSDYVRTAIGNLLRYVREARQLSGASQ
jgi:hypothetical protein